MAVATRLQMAGVMTRSATNVLHAGTKGLRGNGKPLRTIWVRSLESKTPSRDLLSSGASDWIQYWIQSCCARTNRANAASTSQCPWQAAMRPEVATRESGHFWRRTDDEHPSCVLRLSECSAEVFFVGTMHWSYALRKTVHTRHSAGAHDLRCAIDL